MIKLIYLLPLLLSQITFAQKQHELIFYNVENLFDNEVDSTRSYKEFNPEQAKKWNEYKYHQKINGIAKVLNAASVDGPEFIAFAEIENKKVVDDIVNHDLLKEHHYEVIHFESSDVRGIDVAFAFKANEFDLLSFSPIKTPTARRPTRDILLVTGVHQASKDTLAFFINHWPSRYGGKKRSEKSRMLASKTLLKKMKELSGPNIKLIATGDFNDSPKDSSMQLLTKTKQFINTFADSSFSKKKQGSLKYRRKWQVFDQFIISSNLLSTNSLHMKSCRIFHPDWLLALDSKYGGIKPFRTYLGPRYNGGISDHLPVVLNLTF